MRTLVWWNLFPWTTEQECNVRVDLLLRYENVFWSISTLKMLMYYNMIRSKHLIHEQDAVSFIWKLYSNNCECYARYNNHIWTGAVIICCNGVMNMGMSKMIRWLLFPLQVFWERVSVFALHLIKWQLTCFFYRKFLFVWFVYLNFGDVENRLVGRDKCPRNLVRKPDSTYTCKH